MVAWLALSAVHGVMLGAGSSVLPPPPPPFLSIVKEEVTDDTAILPLYSGRIVSWVSRGLTPHPPPFISPPDSPPSFPPSPSLSSLPHPLSLIVSPLLSVHTQLVSGDSTGSDKASDRL